jgi:hypothetical protein
MTLIRRAAFGAAFFPFHNRPDRVRRPDAILEAMRPCREAMTRELSKVKPFGVFYCGMLTVIAAIDAMAMLLIGPENNFWAEGRAPRAQERKADR